jgi:hypothetical protein
MERPRGVTRTERFLTGLAARSFLRLWSSPNPYKDQAKLAGRGHGKELCDLLVVCGDDVVIFSDKECAFPHTGRLHLDWIRWYRRAIQGSLGQIYMAERWVRNLPDRIFLDRACTVRPPTPFPTAPALKVHRVIVAHGVSAEYARELQHSRPGLRIVPAIRGEAHLCKPEDGGRPLAVGQVDPSRGFVHVLDQSSIGLVMTELNTITDFINYLEWKEAACTSGRLAAAESELDLLAFYLMNRNVRGACRLPLAGDSLHVSPGTWELYRGSPAYTAKVEADKISFAIDTLIEEVTQSILDGDVLPGLHNDLRSAEWALRALAKESRVRRRAIAAHLLEKIRKTPHNKHSVRVFFGERPDETCYVLVVAPRSAGLSEEEYRDKRLEKLLVYCAVTKVKYGRTGHVVGIATEPGLGRTYSSDLVLVDSSHWTREDEDMARELIRKGQFFTYAGGAAFAVEDYPVVTPGGISKLSGSPPQSLNSPCRCGSGKTFKNCHGGKRSHGG